VSLHISFCAEIESQRHQSHRSPPCFTLPRSPSKNMAGFPGSQFPPPPAYPNWSSGGGQQIFPMGGAPGSFPTYPVGGNPMGDGSGPVPTYPTVGGTAPGPTCPNPRMGGGPVPGPTYPTVGGLGSGPTCSTSDVFFHGGGPYGPTYPQRDPHQPHPVAGGNVPPPGNWHLGGDRWSHRGNESSRPNEMTVQHRSRSPRRHRHRSSSLPDLSSMPVPDLNLARRASGLISLTRASGHLE
jgi:hypothetical protein